VNSYFLSASVNKAFSILSHKRKRQHIGRRSGWENSRVGDSPPYTNAHIGSSRGSALTGQYSAGSRSVVPDRSASVMTHSLSVLQAGPTSYADRIRAPLPMAAKFAARSSSHTVPKSPHMWRRRIQRVSVEQVKRPRCGDNIPEREHWQLMTDRKRGRCGVTRETREFAIHL
jgi:hypothetical protein